MAGVTINYDRAMEMAELGMEVTEGPANESNPMFWKSLGEEAIKDALRELRTTAVTYLGALVNLLNSYSNYDTEEKNIKAFQNAFGPSGWIPSFNRTNTAAVMGNLSPSFARGLSPEERDAYDAAVHYRMDTILMQGICDDLYKMAMGYPYKKMASICRIHRNMGSAGFTNAMYDRINNDLASASELIKTTGYRGKNSNAFLSSTKLTGDELKNRYFQERLKDYLEALSNNPISDSVIHRGNGMFSIKQDVLVRAKVIDDYTEKAAMITNLDNELATAVERCKKIESNINANIKEFKTPEIKNLLSTIIELCQEICNYSDLTNTIYEGFKKADSQSPFCFMKKLPALGSVPGVYSFAPKQDDPKDKGTSYQHMYQHIRHAISEHCKDFVYKSGSIKQ